MQTRKLGHAGLEVSALGLGCMGMSFGSARPADKREMIALMRAARRAGRDALRHGRDLRPVHERGTRRRGARARSAAGSRSRPSSDSASSNGKQSGLDSRPEHIREVAEASLTRLRIDTIDLLYQHRVDPNVPIEDVAGTVKELIAEGKVRHFGLSEAGAADDPPRARGAARDGAAERVLAVVARARSGDPAHARGTRHRLRAVQPARQGLPDRQDRRDDDVRRHRLPQHRAALLAGEPRKANKALVDLLGAIARTQGGSLRRRLALAWLLAQKPWIVPIPGTTKLHRLEENVGAASVELCQRDLREMDRRLVAQITVQGARYPEQLQRLVGR